MLLVFSACSSKTVSTSSTGEVYKEDLSAHRPTFKAPTDTPDTVSTLPLEDYSNVSVTNDITKPLNTVLDSIDVIRKDKQFVEGFTIQVYSGTNSEEARLARGKVISVLPESSPSLKFEEPNFKVKVGQYYSKIEAQKPYSQLRKKFPGALIIPERIYIR